MKEFSNSTHRKLIRPSLNEVKDQMLKQKRQHQNPNPSRQNPKRSAPPEQTNAESFYYVKQMQNRTSLVLVLKDGEELSGMIEWYDRTCLKINRLDGPNVLVYKDSIKYLYKKNEEAELSAGNSSEEDSSEGNSSEGSSSNEDSSEEDLSEEEVAANGSAAN